MQPLAAGDGLTTPMALGGDFRLWKLLIADHRKEGHEGFLKKTGGNASALEKAQTAC